MKITVDQIEDLLPQTQCTLCGYAGCKPYAEAMLYKNDSIDKCLPGGVGTLKALGVLLQKESEPLVKDMAQKAKPNLLALIDESSCIGCKKCIQACPVDAIMGAPKQMHSIIASECTGCELCVPVCPVDCINMLEISPLENPQDREQKAKHAKRRYSYRQIRLQRQAMEASEKHRQLKFANASTHQDTVLARKQEIQAALLRMKSKRQKNGR